MSAAITKNGLSLERARRGLDCTIMNCVFRCSLRLGALRAGLMRLLSTSGRSRPCVQSLKPSKISGTDMLRQCGDLPLPIDRDLHLQATARSALELYRLFVGVGRSICREALDGHLLGRNSSSAHTMAWPV